MQYLDMNNTPWKTQKTDHQLVCGTTEPKYPLLRESVSNKTALGGLGKQNVRQDAESLFYLACG